MNLIKYFMRVLLFTLRQVILISSFGNVILMCCGDNFSNIIFIQPLSLGCFLASQNHIRTSLRSLQDADKTCTLQLLIRPYVNVLKTSIGFSLWVTCGTTLGRLQDVTLGHLHNVGRGRPQDVRRELTMTLHKGLQGTSIGPLLGMSSGHPRDVISPSG